MSSVERLPFPWVMFNSRRELRVGSAHHPPPSLSLLSAGHTCLRRLVLSASFFCLPASPPALHRGLGLQTCFLSTFLLLALLPPRSLFAAAEFCQGPCVWMRLGRSRHSLLAPVPDEFLLLIPGSQMLLSRRYFLTSLPLLQPTKDHPQK